MSLVDLLTFSFYSEEEGAIAEQWIALSIVCSTLNNNLHTMIQANFNIHLHNFDTV